ncbi:unnamed protein product [Thelazia callipaeda]|uniref:MAM domain-containing protein n=1 Tax=Thelazia callipaeda TaxID=103827 RepID=A0A0N5D930_THECL|nr:unnamed protein product [Thelazia callipaeda]
MKSSVLIEDLSCDFDDGTFCQWQSDSDLWLIGSNVLTNFIQPIPHFTAQNGLYAYAKGGQGVSVEGHLISTEIEEFNNQEAILSFRYWKSNNFCKLDVCIADRNAFVCTFSSQNELNKESRWIKQTITLSNKLTTPFKVIFRARNIYTPLDIVAIDDIEYRVNFFKIHATTVLTKLDEILTKEQARKTSCPAVNCTFIDTSCQCLEAPWQHLQGNIAVDSEGEGIARSGFFMVPAESFLQMDVWMADSAILTVLEATASLGNWITLWTQSGLPDRSKWNRFQIPLLVQTEAIQVILNGTVPINSFITVSNTKLVNRNGNEIGCGINSPDIEKSLQNNFSLNKPERLIAFQQFYINQARSTSKTAQKNVLQTKTATSKDEITKGHDLRDQISVPKPSINTPLLIDNEKRYKSLAKNDTSTLELNTQFPRKPPIYTRLHENSLAKQKAFEIFDDKSNSTSSNDTVKELGAILSQIGRQPLLEMHLRQLAHLFNFTQMDAEQALKMLKNLVKSKVPQSSAAKFFQAENDNLEPIRPINAPPQIELVKFLVNI